VALRRVAWIARGLAGRCGLLCSLKRLRDALGAGVGLERAADMIGARRGAPDGNAVVYLGIGIKSIILCEWNRERWRS